MGKNQRNKEEKETKVCREEYREKVTVRMWLEQNVLGLPEKSAPKEQKKAQKP